MLGVTRRHNNKNEVSSHLRFGMEARNEHQTARRFNALFYGTTALGITIFVLVLVWVFGFRNGLAGRSDPKLEFNWHPILMFGGMILLYSQAILLYRSRRYEPKKKLKLGHASINFMVIFLSIFGLIAVFDSHNLVKPPIPNLYTMHSWMGLTTVIAFCLQFVAGFTAFLFPGFAKEARAALLPAHTSIGTAIFVLASFTTLMGFTEKAIFSLGNSYGSLPSEAYLVNFLAVLTAFFSVLTLYLINEKDYKRQGTPEDEIALTRTE